MKTKIVTWSVRLMMCLVVSALQLAGQPQPLDSTRIEQIEEDSSAAAQAPVEDDETLDAEEVSSKSDSVQPTLIPVAAPETLAPPNYPSQDPVSREERSTICRTNPARSIGIECAYLYYKEMDLLSGKISSYTEQFGMAPLVIRGEPKSVEHGYLQGITYAVNHRIGVDGGYFRPSFTPLLSLYTTYDGSSQGDTILDRFGNVIGIDFVPVTGHKMNIFLTGSGIIGYQKPNARTSFGLYSGLRLRLWYRSMNDLDDSRDDDLFSAETYLWASIPMGLNIRRRVGEQWRLGADISLDCMLIGFMKIFVRVDKSDVKFNYPLVNLGNKAGYRLGLSAEKRISPRLVLAVAPYITVYGFGKSNTEVASAEYQGSRLTIGEFYEPQSGSILGGLSFTFDLGADW